MLTPLVSFDGTRSLLKSFSKKENSILLFQVCRKKKSPVVKSIYLHSFLAHKFLFIWYSKSFSREQLHQTVHLIFNWKESSVFKLYECVFFFRKNIKLCIKSKMKLTNSISQNNVFKKIKNAQKIDTNAFNTVIA